MAPEEAIERVVDVAADRGGPLVRDASRVKGMLQGSVVGDCIPGVVLELPLGDGSTDAMAVYRYQRPEPDGHVWFPDMFRWFSTTSGDSAIGITLDTGTYTAGAYLEFGEESYNVAPFAESIGLDPTWVTECVSMTPERWPVHYVGHFPSRQGRPLRIGGYLSSDSMRELTSSEMHAFAPTDGAAETGLRVAGLAAEFGCTADWQMDVLRDGSIGSRFSMGVGVSNLPDDDLLEVLDELGVGYGYSRSLLDMRHTEELGDCTVTLIPSMVKTSHDGTDLVPKAYVSATVTPR